MKKRIPTFIGSVVDLFFVKVLNNRKKNQLLSEVHTSKTDETPVKNWGKTAVFLPETGENHLAASLYQLELERTKVSALALTAL